MRNPVPGGTAPRARYVVVLMALACLFGLRIAQVRAVEMMPPPLADIKKSLDEAATENTTSTELIGKVDALFAKVNLKTDGLELNADTIKALSDGTKALKDAPIGGTAGFAATTAARLKEATGTKQPMAEAQAKVNKAIEDLTKLKTTAESDRKTKSETLATKQAERDAAKKTLDEKMAAVPPVPADVMAAQMALKTAEDALTAAKTAHEEAVKAVTAIDTELTRANTLKTALAATKTRLETLQDAEKDGSLAKTVGRLFAYGNRLVALQNASLKATGFPELSAEPKKADPGKIARAFSGHSLSLARAEPFGAPLQSAADSLRASTRAADDGFATLGANLLPGDKAFEAAVTAGNTLCKDSRDQYGTLKQCVESLDDLFLTLRDSADIERGKIAGALKILRDSMNQLDPEFGNKLLVALETLNLGLALAAEQRVTEEAWPVAGGLLGSRWAGDIKKTDAAFKEAHEAIGRLRPFLVLVQDFQGGNTSAFVSQHVRLYYLPSVPRLMNVLNPGVQILNPEGKAAIEAAKDKEDALRKLELEMANNLGNVVNLRRKIEGAVEEVRLAEVRVKNAEKQFEAASRHVAELTPEKAKADKAAADQEIKVKELTAELTNLKSTRTSLMTQITAKETELMTLSAAVPPDMVMIAKVQKELAALREQLAEVESKIEKKQKEVGDAELELERKKAAKKYYDDLHAGREKEKTEAQTLLTERKTQRDQLTGENVENETSLKALRKRQEEAEVRVNEQRRSIELDAIAENRAFGEAREKSPIYVSQAHALSPDPVKRVTLFGFGDSKTMLMRGLPEDVEKTLEIIAGFDAPAPQARVTLWTLQFNADNTRKMNDRLLDIDRTLADLRSDITFYQETLRTSISKQVNMHQQDVQSLTRGTALEMSPRLARTLFYAQEIRERLGFRLPCQSFWNLALSYLRVKSDFNEMHSLAVLIASINARLAEIGKSQRDEDWTHDETHHTTGCCKAPMPAKLCTCGSPCKHSKCTSTDCEEAKKKYKEQENRLRAAAARATGDEAKTLREKRRLLDSLLYSAFEELRESFRRFQQYTAAETTTTLSCEEECLSPRQRDQLRLAKQDLDYAVTALGNLSTGVVKELIDQHGGEQSEEQLLFSRYGGEPLVFEDESKDPCCVIARSFREGKRFLGGAQRAITRIAQSILPDSPDTITPNDKCHQILAALSIKDAEYVTRWTVPDPAHSTTLGEAMFVLTMARRSHRMGVLRSFARELIRQRSVAPGGRQTSKASKKRYERFGNDCVRVLQGLLSSSPTPSRVGVAVEPGAMPRFPGLPQALLGAINGTKPALQDNELTPNQHEVLQALLSKARSSCGTEVQHLVREIDWFKTRRGGEKAEDDFVLSRREQYLPLIGWLSTQNVNTVKDVQEIRDALKRASRIPQPYRFRGADAVGFRLNPNGGKAPLAGAADRLAWAIGREQVSGNSLAAATPRVAAADAMIKRLMKVIEDDIDYYFVAETLRELQDLIEARPTGTGPNIEQAVKNALGVSRRPVRLGIIERTSLLTTNRMVARLSPNATAGLEVPGAEDFLMQSQQLAQLAQGVNNSFFAPERSRNAIGAAGAAAGIASIAGSAGSALGPIGALAGVFSLLEEQRREPPGEVYTLNSGNTFKLTPIFDPSGQAMRFKFDHVSMTRLREPDGTINPLVPRVERMTTNTEVQLSNLELHEVARYHQNAQLGIPEKRTGGVPFLRSLPILKDLPLVGYYTRQKGKPGVVQESVILGQTVIYPTVGEVVDLLVDAPRRLALGDLAPTGLWEPQDRTQLVLQLESEKFEEVRRKEVIVTPRRRKAGEPPVYLQMTNDEGMVTFKDLRQDSEYDVALRDSRYHLTPGCIPLGKEASFRTVISVKAPPAPDGPIRTFGFWRLKDTNWEPAVRLAVRVHQIGGDSQYTGFTNERGEIRVAVSKLPNGRYGFDLGYGLTGWTTDPKELDLGDELTHRIRLVPAPAHGPAVVRVRLLAPVGGTEALAAVRRQKVVLIDPHEKQLTAVTDEAGIATFYSVSTYPLGTRFKLHTQLHEMGFRALTDEVELGDGGHPTDVAFERVPVEQHRLRVYVIEKVDKLPNRLVHGARVELRPEGPGTLVQDTGEDGSVGFSPNVLQTVVYKVFVFRKGMQAKPMTIKYVPNSVQVAVVELSPQKPAKPPTSKKPMPGPARPAALMKTEPKPEQNPLGGKVPIEAVQRNPRQGVGAPAKK